MNLDPTSWDWSRIGKDVATGGLYEGYKKFYEDPANDQKNALANAQGQLSQLADYNRQLQLSGLNRALTFYGPARDVLSQMMGGAPPSGYGQLSQGPTGMPTPPNLNKPPGKP